MRYVRPAGCLMVRLLRLQRSINCATCLRITIPKWFLPSARDSRLAARLAKDKLVLRTS